MGYALHIERSGEISLEEWQQAVESVDGVRLTDRDLSGRNPSTDEAITIAAQPGDAEVLCKVGGFLGFGAKSQWVRAFRFSRGSVTFGASPTIELPKDPVHIAAARLAGILDASIVGDDGEEYEW